MHIHILSCLFQAYIRYLSLRMRAHEQLRDGVQNRFV